jgi:hypothetical protein
MPIKLIITRTRSTGACTYSYAAAAAMALAAATAAVLLVGSLPAANSTPTPISIPTATTTKHRRNRGENPHRHARHAQHRHLLDTDDVSPRTPLMSAAQWLTFVSTEVGEEFEADDAHTTTPELAELAEAIWAEASRFEYARAIRDGTEETAGPGGVQPYPFLICDGKEAETQAERAGYARRQRVADAIRVAAEATNVALPEDGGTPYEVLINNEDVWCGYGLLNGIVAEAVEVDGVVQPLMMSMKMAENTVTKLLEGVEDFYNATERIEEEAGADTDADAEEVVQDKKAGEGGVGPDETVIGLPEPVKNIVFPSATITMCPGALSEKSYNELMEQSAESTDLTVEMNAWLLEQTGEFECWILAL